MSRQNAVIIVTLVLIIILSIQPCAAATTGIHVVKYANDGTTILNETTKTYQWMEANMPVLGDGVTHYYHQGPVFVDDPDEEMEQQLRWNPDEDTNVLEKDMGAVKGTNLKDLCDLVGGMNAGETVKVRASDGLSMTFAYRNVYGYSSKEGPMVVTWYCAGLPSYPGPYPDNGYTDGMRLVWFADTSVNPWGVHAFGNYDWHESAAPEYWYYYLSGSEEYPTTTGLSVKYISDVFIYSDDSPPSPPVAAFLASTRTGTAPLTVSFTDASTGTGPLTYVWTFGDSGTSSSPNPTHIYTTAGTYTVSLTVTNAVSSDSEVKTGYITVSAAPVAPVAAFTASPRTGTAPFTVSFTDASTGTGPLTYVWTFGDSGTSSSPNPTHIFTTAGTYTVSLTVTNAVSSDSEVKTGYITVSAAPVAPVAAFSGTPRSGIAPFTVSFADQSTGTAPLAYAWDFQNDGIVDSALKNPSYQYAAAGTYTVNLTVTNTAGSDAEVKTGYITVNATPVLPATRIGVFRPSTHIYYQDYDGNGVWNGGVIDRAFNFGITGDVPVSGDWNGDGRTEIGVFRPSTHLYYLDYNGNGVWNGGVIDRAFNFGITGDVPVSGDWNGDGRTEIGVFRPSTHLYYQDYNGNGVWNGGVIDRAFNFGITGDVPVSGDWNGDGRTEIGVFRPSTHLYYQDYNGNGAWNGAVIIDRAYNFGITGDIPVSGDWNGDGRTEIGVFRPSTHLYYQDYNGNGAWNGGVIDRAYNFGMTGDSPVAGNWS